MKNLKQPRYSDCCSEILITVLKQWAPIFNVSYFSNSMLSTVPPVHSREMTEISNHNLFCSSVLKQGNSGYQSFKMSQRVLYLSGTCPTRWLWHPLTPPHGWLVRVSFYKRVKFNKALSFTGGCKRKAEPALFWIIKFLKQVLFLIGTFAALMISHDQLLFCVNWLKWCNVEHQIEK